MPVASVEVRQAQLTDHAAAVSLYTRVVDAMRGTPWDIEWDMAWHPTPALLTQAIERGELYVAVKDGEPVGAFVLNGDQAPDYAKVAWGVDAPESKVSVLHLLAVSPVARGAGVGFALVHSAQKIAREAGSVTLRLDVLANNAPAIELYRRCGMRDLGVYTLEIAEGFSRPAHLMEADPRS